MNLQQFTDITKLNDCDGFFVLSVCLDLLSDDPNLKDLKNLMTSSVSHVRGQDEPTLGKWLTQNSWYNYQFSYEQLLPLVEKRSSFIDSRFYAKALFLEPTQIATADHLSLLLRIKRKPQVKLGDFKIDVKRTAYAYVSTYPGLTFLNRKAVKGRLSFNRESYSEQLVKAIVKICLLNPNMDYNFPGKKPTLFDNICIALMGRDEEELLRLAKTNRKFKSNFEKIANAVKELLSGELTTDQSIEVRIFMEGIFDALVKAELPVPWVPEFLGGLQEQSYSGERSFDDYEHESESEEDSGLEQSGVHSTRAGKS